jgi:polyisoprenyl-phosphate glycosyltransferase
MEEIKLSIISPVYKGEKMIYELVSRIENSIQSITASYEIILVEDCGGDNSWNVIEKISQNNINIKGIKLSRNFGQHYAITCGLDHAKGEWVVVMDCDLQDRPEEIPNLYKKAIEGYDIVLAQRFNRQDKFFKKLFSRIFYRTLGYLTGSEQDETVANFGIYHQKVIKQLVLMRESIRYFPTMVKWVGFKVAKIQVEHAEREIGSSNYNFKRLINLALDIILAYSDKPLRITIKLGFGISLVSLLMAFFIIIKWLSGGIIVLGYTSLIISVWFLSGCILTTLGIVGLYIGKTFEGVKKRPIYIIDRIIND